MKPPYAPHLYSKIGVRRGIPIFLIFAPKHRLWVLVTIFALFLAKTKKKRLKILIFTAENKSKKSILLHGQVDVMSSFCSLKIFASIVNFSHLGIILVASINNHYIILLIL